MFTNFNLGNTILPFMIKSDLEEFERDAKCIHVTRMPLKITVKIQEEA